jgi:opacity protein-like surface antigen
MAATTGQAHGHDDATGGFDMSSRRSLGVALVLMMMTAAPARADVLLIPFFGVNFGGDSGKNLADAFDADRFSWGVSLAAMGAGVFGVEADLAYSPDFFGKTDVGGSSVLTAMGNVVIGIPFGGQRGFGIRPYALAGVGLLRSSSDFGGVFDLDENQFAWNFGGGVMLFFGTRVGVRADIRYIRTFDKLDILGIDIVDAPGKVDFTRTSAGLIFRF